MGLMIRKVWEDEVAQNLRDTSFKLISYLLAAWFALIASSLIALNLLAHALTSAYLNGRTAYELLHGVLLFATLTKGFAG